MPSILNAVKPLIDRGTFLLSNVPGPAGALAKKVGPAQPKAGMNDQTVKSKVESALYRLPGVARSKVNVTVADGVVTVHGEARSQAQMTSIETAVRGVPEVQGFESQLHLPKTPAPSTPAAGRKQATKKKPAATTKAATRGRTQRVNRDKTTSQAEPTPAKKAATRQGRTPAPMGSTGDAGDAGEAKPANAGQSASTVAQVKSEDAS